LLSAFFTAVLSSCSLLQSDPAGNAVSVYDHLSYFLEDCGSAGSANVAQTVLPVMDLVMPHGYYRSWWQTTTGVFGGFWTAWGAFETVYPVSDFTRNRVTSLMTFINQFRYDHGTFLGIENLWYYYLHLAFYYPPIFDNLEQNNWDRSVYEFGLKDYKEGYGYELYRQYYDSLMNNDLVNSIEQFLLIGWPVYATFVAITEPNGLEQSLWHLLNLVTAFSQEIISGFYWEQRGLWERVESQFRYLISVFDILDSSLWEGVSEMVFTVHEIFSTFHQIARSLIRGSGRLLYQIAYGKDVFSYAESLVSDVPIVREIYNLLKFLSDEIREVTRYILDTFKIEEGLLAIIDNVTPFERELLVVTSFTYIVSLPVRIADTILYSEQNAFINQITNLGNGNSSNGNGGIDTSV